MLKKNPILTVSDLTYQIKENLDRSFQKVWVKGEISNLTKYASGHIYLSLKDTKAQIRLVIFSSTKRRITFPLETGASVVVWGRLIGY